MEKQTKFIIAIVALLLFMVFNYNDINSLKQAVADIQGKACALDNDCPCIGTYNYTTISNPNAFGIGVGECVNNKCDMGYCIGLEPVGTWVKENPLAYLKTNPVMLVAILGVLLLLIFYPKR
jgi:hypothetical protein